MNESSNRLLLVALNDPQAMNAMPQTVVCNVAKAAFQKQMECELKRAAHEANDQVQSLVYLTLAIEAGRLKAA